MTQGRIYADDLDPKLWVPYDNVFLKTCEIKIEQLEDWKNEVFVAIEKAKKGKESWHEEQEREEKERKEKERKFKEKSKKERKFREVVHKEIGDKLSAAPYTLESELDSTLWAPYSVWMIKLWEIEISQLENFKKQMLTAIEKAKEKRKLMKFFENLKIKRDLIWRKKFERSMKN